MPARFVHIDRNTPLLLPPDLHEWLSPDDPARLVVDLVDSIDLCSARVNERGTGSLQYPPSMMLPLLLYCYSAGFFSSREIEELTHTHIGVRYICANEHPDHDTICKFRRENRELIRDTFAQSLHLAAAAGILKIGELDVATDGTKLSGNLNSSQTKSIEDIDQEIEKLDQKREELQISIDELLEQAENADNRDKQKQERMSADLVDPKQRREILREASEELRRKERRRARLEAAKHSLAEIKDRKHEEREAERDKAKSQDIGRVPDKRSPEVSTSDKVNITDPESVKMHAHGEWTEGYNGQTSVDTASGLIVGAYAIDEASDKREVTSNINELESNLGKGSAQTMVMDTGYDNTGQIAEAEETGGPTVLAEQVRKDEAERKSEAPRGRFKRTKERRDEYYERMREPANRQLRHRRRETVEPTFGIIKEQMGFRRFSLRGRENADTEWRLVNFAFNLRKLSRNEKWNQWLRKNRAAPGMN